MTRTTLTRLAAVAAWIAVLPGAPIIRAQSQPAAIAVGGPARADGGTVTGTVWDRRDVPVPKPRLRLRDVRSGQIVRTSEGDELGRFSFSQVPPGSYLVELVDRTGNVIALGQMFSLSPLETVATFLRLGAAVPWYRGFFSNAAAVALASAAALALVAVGNGGQPASGRS